MYNACALSHPEGQQLQFSSRVPKRLKCRVSENLGSCHPKGSYCLMKLCQGPVYKEAAETKLSRVYKQLSQVGLPPGQLNCRASVHSIN